MNHDKRFGINALKIAALVGIGLFSTVQAQAIEDLQELMVQVVMQNITNGSLMLMATEHYKKQLNRIKILP